MNTLVANHVVAVPVAAPPGRWIGANGSMILESDKQTGEVRKHYIGIATMLDILAHIAGDDRVNGGDDDASSDLDKKMSVPVSSIVGHCLEGLSLWTPNPNTSISGKGKEAYRDVLRSRFAWVASYSATDMVALDCSAVYRAYSIFSNLCSYERFKCWGKGIVACHTDSPIAEVMDKVVTQHVHRVWVMD